MDYDFTTLTRRDDSIKWQLMRERRPDLDGQVIPLTVADMEWRPAPEIVDGLKAYLERTILGYPRITDDYLDAVIGWMKRRHDFSVERAWIYPTSGIVPAVYAAIHALTSPQDGVILMPPVYFPFYSAIRDTKRTAVDCPLIKDGSRYAIDFERFENQAKDPKNTLFILCSPHNPVGRVWTKEELIRIDEICRRHQVAVLADEIHHDLVMPGYKHTVFQTLSDETAMNTITCTAPTKTFNLAGMGVSNLIIKNDMWRKRYDTYEEQAGFPSVTLLGYKACELAYAEAENWLNQALIRIDRNRQICESFFSEYFPETTIATLEGTYLLWVDVSRVPGIERSDVRFQPLDGKMFGQGGEGFWRLNLALPEAHLKTQLTYLAEDFARI